MPKAKFKLDFEVDACLDINQEMKLMLSDGSQIVFYESKRPNLGTILVEIDEPNEIIARDVGRQRVEDFFTYMLIIKDNLENLTHINFPRKPELLNPEDFKGVPKTGYADFKVGYAITVKLEQQELDATRELIAKTRKLPQDKQDIISRSLWWFRKASEVKGEERFIFRWISFDALLGLLKKRKATQNLIPEFMDRFMETKTTKTIFQKHERTINDLSNANLMGLSGVSYSKQLRTFLEERKHPRAILPKAVLCIFEVRNALFHRGEALGLIEMCSSLLKDVIRECLKFYVRKET